jgi:putative MFS transporter
MSVEKNLEKTNWNIIFSGAVIVSALGYFVDIYDLLLFSIIRVQSLKDLGLSAEEITDKGLLLINLQMVGMLIGGIFFGILGDKKGRLSILFGSILLYSIANLLNAFVQTVEQYAVLRFVAGVGLAGELGAGVSLVVESLPKKVRGYGTMIIASVGVCGAALAWFVADHVHWRVAYLIGGLLGFCLLLLRIRVSESEIFHKIKNANIVKGDFLMIFRSKKLFIKYFCCILSAVQIWYLVGILITLSPEFSKAMNIQGEVVAGKAVLFCYLGLAFGDLLTGWLSQMFQSRKKVLGLFLSLSALSIFAYFQLHDLTAEVFYVICFFMGVSSGYWAIFVTMAAESFGTNLRATVATTAPNFVRGALVPISWLFAMLKPEVGMLPAAAWVGVVCVGLSFLGLFGLPETFEKDLDYNED